MMAPSSIDTGGGFWWDTLMGYRILNERAFQAEPDCRSGPRRFHLGITLKMTLVEKQIKKLFKYTGFSAVKMPRLRKTYVNEEMVKLTRERIAQRMEKKKKAMISVGFNFGTGSKNSKDKTGDCLSGISFNLIPRGKDFWQCITIVSWRAVEVTRRFVADLQLIYDLIGEIGFPVGPHKVILQFGSLFSHSMHWMLWYHMNPDAMKNKPDRDCLRHLERVNEKDIKYGPFKRAAKAYLRNKEQGLPALFTVQNRPKGLRDGGGESVL